MSSLEDCWGQERSKTPQMTGEHNLTDVWPPRSRTSRRGRRDVSVGRSLTKVRRSPQEGPGHGSCLRRRDRVAEPPPHQEPSQKHKLIPKAGTTIDADLGDRRGGATRCSCRTAVLPTLSNTLAREVQNPKEMWRPLRISI